MYRRRNFVKDGIVFAAASSLALEARADSFGYAGVVDLAAVRGRFRVDHHHDWTRNPLRCWTVFCVDQDVFAAENTYSWLVLTDQEGSRQLFRAPVPALTHLWISPDGRFIVGLSNIKLRNPAQVVVFNVRGDRLLARAVDYSTFRGVEESVTNWVRWYKEPTPQISIETTSDGLLLSVQSNDSEPPRTFTFTDRA